MNNTEKPKYQKLKEYIIKTIESSKLIPGDRIYSENELADQFDISRHTVRQAIGELVSEGWLYRVQGKGTFVGKRSDENGFKTKTIAVMTTYLNDYIFPSIIRGIDRVLSMNGYNIILSCTYNSHDKERLCLKNLLEQNIDGLIIEPTKSALPNPNIHFYRELSRMGIPVLFIHGCYRELDCSSVVEDDVLAGYKATKHLIDLGHKKICGVFKNDDIQGHCRYEGFLKAHMDAGIQIKDSRVMWFETNDMEEFLVNGIYGIAGNILDECSAVVCYNEQIAVKIMDFLRDRNINIPGDISLVSFDDSQLAVASEIKLTTIAHPKEKLGEEAANTIIEMIGDSESHYSIKMEPELVIRGSTRSIDERMVE